MVITLTISSYPDRKKFNGNSIALFYQNSIVDIQMALVSGVAGSGGAVDNVGDDDAGDVVGDAGGGVGDGDGGDVGDEDSGDVAVVEEKGILLFCSGGSNVVGKRSCRSLGRTEDAFLFLEKSIRLYIFL